MTIASSNTTSRNSPSRGPGDHNPGTAEYSRGPLTSARPPLLEEDSLNDYVDASVQAWRAYVEAGLASSFYHDARKHLEPFDAATITLLKSYLDAVFPGLEDGDPDSFYFYADSFQRELCMPELARANELPARALLMGKMKRLLKDWQGKSRPDYHAFLAAILKMCSSLESIIHARDVYKEYMFRIYPQLQVRVA